MLTSPRSPLMTIFYDIPEIYTCKFDGYNGFSTSPVVDVFGPNRVYAVVSNIISRVSDINAIIPSVCTVAALVCYIVNVLSGRNRPVYVKKLRNLFLFKPDNIFMKTLEATTQLGSFNQRLPMQQSNK